MIFGVVFSIIVIFFSLTFLATYLVHQMPRMPVKDKPDWGKVEDVKISSIDGGHLELWRIHQDKKSKGTVLFAHGWGRNRDRMVNRARMFGSWGYTTLIYSARDHGGSSSKKFMNAVRFAEDIEAVMKTSEEPVILYGHSAGAAGAIIAAHRNPKKVKLLFMEGSYAYTKEALMNLYKWFNPTFGRIFGPFILLWMDILYGKNMIDSINPARLAPDLNMPVMLIQGEKDRRFPVDFAKTLLSCFNNGNAEFFIAKGAGHSDSSLTADYPKTIKTFLTKHHIF